MDRLVYDKQVFIDTGKVEKDGKEFTELTSQCMICKCDYTQLVTDITKVVYPLRTCLEHRGEYRKKPRRPAKPKKRTGII